MRHASGRLLAAVRWLQAHPLAIVGLVAGLVEGWYAIERGLHSAGSGAVDTLRTVYLLLAVIGVMGAIFAGRDAQSWRSTAINLLILMASSGAAFVMFAYAYAGLIARPDYLPAHTVWGMVMPDPDFGYVGRPNLRDHLTYLNEENRFVPVSTDAYGFRNPGDVSGAPIAGIGDSVIFGLWVTADELWSARLAEELGVAVANYSLLGYEMLRYNLLAERYARPADHSLVIYFIYDNDLYSDVDAVPSAGFMEGLLWTTKSPLTYMVTEMRTFFSESPTVQIVRALHGQGEAQPRARPAGRDPWPCTFLPNTYTPDHNPMLATRLDRAAELAREGGYSLLFAVIPTQTTVYAEEFAADCGPQAAANTAAEREGYAFVCAYVSQQGYPCLDMLEAFRAEAARGERLFYPVDTHWTPAGHALAARLVAAAIREGGLLP